MFAGNVFIRYAVTENQTYRLGQVLCMTSVQSGGFSWGQHARKGCGHATAPIFRHVTIPDENQPLDTKNVRYPQAYAPILWITFACFLGSALLL